MSSSSSSTNLEVEEIESQLSKKMSLQTSDEPVVTLKCSDGEKFKVEQPIVVQLQTVMQSIEGDDCVVTLIPLPNITGPILSKVLEYCKKHTKTWRKEADDRKRKDAGFYKMVEDTEEEKEMMNWDNEYMKDTDMDTMYHLINAANYLNVDGLLHLICQTIADMIKGKSPDEMRKIFNIKNDFTPEQKAEIRQEHEWAFEGM